MREGNILITNSRIEINGQTFAVRNVGSVKIEVAGRPFLAGFCAVFGLAMAASASTRTAGVLIALVAGAVMVLRMLTRQLILVSGGGQTLALKSTNGELIERTRKAVVQAISAR